MEYVLLVTIILRCHSYYASPTASDSISMSDWLEEACLIMLIAVVVLNVCLIWMRGGMTGKKLAHLLAVPAAVLAYMLVVYVLNVLRLYPKGAESFQRLFLAGVPLFVILFRLKRSGGKTFDLLFKFSDIVCVFAVLNLTVYFAGIIHTDSFLADIAYTSWSGDSRTHIVRTNLVNLCLMLPGLRWQMLGIRLLRNYGIFSEPLMYSIALITSFFTELFLRPKTDPLRPWRLILLSVTEVTSQAVLGIVLMVGGWALKGIEILIHKNRKVFIIPIVVITLIAAGFVVGQKQRQYANLSEDARTSTGDHLEDFQIGIRAFLTKPVLGGGYKNSKYLRSFMTEERYATNRGFSNGISVIIGQGGIVFGFACVFPYVILLLQIFSRCEKNRPVGLFACGVLGLVLVTVPHYQFYFSMVLGLGLSLLEFERGRKLPWKLSIIRQESVWEPYSGTESLSQSEPREEITPAEERRREFDAESGETALPKEHAEEAAERGSRIRAAAAALVTTGICAFLALFGLPVWNWLYAVLKSNRLMMGQYPLGSYCLWLVILFNGFLLHLLIKKELSAGTIIYTAAYDLVCVCMYVRVSAWISAILAIHGGSFEEYDALFVLALYAAGWVFFLILIRQVSNWRNLVRWERQAGAVFAVLVCLGAVCVGIKSERVLARGEEGLVSELGAVSAMTENASGRVFANDLSLVWHLADPHISISTARDEGFSVYTDASVIFRKGDGIRELFDAGYEVTELSEDLVVYTRDQSMIDAMTAEGFRFYRYYPYPVEKKKSRYFVKSGKYTVHYSLQIDPAEYEGLDPDTVICNAYVYTDIGDQTFAAKDVLLSEFDAGGHVDVELTFTLTADTERLRFLVDVPEEFAVYCPERDLTETPDYVTLRTYNSHRNVVREEYYTADGEPFVQTAGYSMLERIYNSLDEALSLRYYLDGQPVLVSSGCARIDYEYNREARVVKETYYGTDGQPAALATGQGSAAFGYDDSGNRNEERYYGLDGEPVNLAAGYAEVRRVFDEKRRLIREEYYDADGGRVMNTSGYSGYVRELDGDGNVLTLTYLDTADQPVIMSYGYAILRRTYDEEGRIASESYFDEQDQPLPLSSGYASLQRTYNSNGWIARESYFDTDGSPVLNTSGYAAEEREYDSVGNIAVSRYFDTDGNPCSMIYGYAEIHREFNEKKQKIREFYFDTDGNPTASTGGYFGFDFAYDEVGNVSDLTYLDAMGQPMTAPNGITRIRYEYDERRNRTAEYYYDAEGNPVNCTGGYSEIQRTYDENNNVISTTYYNAAGEQIEPAG